jgi:hypothetical protein
LLVRDIDSLPTHLGSLHEIIERAESHLVFHAPYEIPSNLSFVTFHLPLSFFKV